MVIAQNEQQYEKTRIIAQIENNYKNTIARLKKDMEEYPVLVERYNKNIKNARQLVEQLNIVHNTNVDSIISIFKTGKIMCADRLKVIGYPYRKRVSAEYLKKNLNSYIYGVIAPGETLFGPIEIVFKRDVEQLEGAIFIYKNHFAYTAKAFAKAQMSIKHWRNFLSEKISLEFDDITGYPEKIPACERLEFYFPDSLELSYIEKIVCCNRDYFSELTSRLETEFGVDNQFKHLVALQERNIH